MIKIPRIHIEGALYYVTSRGDHNEDIFRDEDDYKQYSELLKKYKEQYGFKLFAFCLMPNHLHLLVELKEGLTISDIMHDLNSNYTKYFNGRYEKKGHLFQERCKMNLIEKTPYLLYVITAYIHLNPKVAGKVLEVKDYTYSSYPLYEKGEGTRFLVLGGLNLDEEIKEVLSAFHQHLGVSAKPRTYADHLVEISKEEMEILGKDLTKKTILGSQEFIEKVNAVIAKGMQIEGKGEEIVPRIPSRNLILAGGAVVLLLGILTFGLYNRTLAVKENYKKELEKKEVEMGTRLVKEKEEVYKNLDEKYRADRISYEAMHKRLEFEKKRIADLEKKLEKR